jgi:hypothetical protein
MDVEGRLLHGFLPCDCEWEKAEMHDPSIDHASGRGFGSIGHGGARLSVLSGPYGVRGKTRVFSLSPLLWDEHQWITDEENGHLELTFTPEELDEVLLSMKVDSAPVRTACRFCSSKGSGEPSKDQFFVS